MLKFETHKFFLRLVTVILASATIFILGREKSGNEEIAYAEVPAHSSSNITLNSSLRSSSKDLYSKAGNETEQYFDDQYIEVDADPSSDTLSTDDYLSRLSLDRVLVESVISIIQSYYVDKSRVTNVEIYHHCVDVMKKIFPDYKVESGHLKVSSLGKRMSLPASYSKLSFSTLMKRVMEASTFADKALASRGIKEKYNLVRGILENLDAHTTLMFPEEYQELKEGTEGVFGGLGVMVGMRDDLLTVIQPIPNSPASRIGIKKRDKILSIDGVNTYGSTLDALVEHMRGAPGTEVNLRILRENELAVQNLNIVREIIQVESVESKEVLMNGNRFLYVAIESFASRTTSEVKEALAKYRARNGGKTPGVILDLRANPGGLLDQAVSVSDLFIDSGVIVSTKGRKEEVETAKAGRHELGYPLVVLINGESASASEILAGALQDHSRALVIGQQSFGKGSVQTVFELPGQNAVKLTIARYYTPKGRTIQSVGITPDIVFEPIYKKERNENLLGEFRYRGEMTLENALKSKSLLEKNNKNALFRSYYLEPLTDYEPTSKEDVEFQLAKYYLAEVRRKYPKTIPEYARRADHQTAIVSKKISTFLTREAKVASEYLAKKHSIIWEDSIVGHKKLSLQLAGPEVLSVLPGKKAYVPVRIFNDSAFDVNRVSLNIQTEESALYSHEILVGQIKHGSSLEKSLELKIPGYWEKGVVDGKIALVVGGQVRGAPIPFKLDVKHRKMAVLDAKVSMVGEKGGSADGLLEPNESAKIVVEVHNKSRTSASATNVKLYNLAGKQIWVGESSESNLQIPPGKKKLFYFDIKGAGKLVDKDLSLGVYLDSVDIAKPLMKETQIGGRPGSAVGRTHALSH